MNFKNLKSIFKVNSQVKYVHVQRRGFREDKNKIVDHTCVLVPRQHCNTTYWDGIPCRATTTGEVNEPLLLPTPPVFFNQCDHKS